MNRPVSSSSARPERPKGRWRLAGIGLLALASSGCGDLERPRVLVTGPPVPPEDRPIEVLKDGFVSSDACRACHPNEYETWHSSYHRTMTQVVSPATMLAPFDDLTLSYLGQTYELDRRGDEFWLELEDPEWTGDGPPPRVWRQIVMSTGSHHLQAYWFASGVRRKLSLFVLCYRIDEGLWMPVDSAFLADPKVRRKTGKGRWNIGCVQCHATKGITRQLEPGQLDTQAVEFGISCEACHGPGLAHVEANRNPFRRYGLHFSDEPDPTIVNPGKLDTKLSSQVCGQCHGITRGKSEEIRASFNMNGKPFNPGDELSATRTLGTEGNEFFWSDGMVRVSGREYNGLTSSPCYQHDDESRRMSCLSCHKLHRDPDDPRGDAWRDDQLAPHMRGDQGCTQCHTEFDSPERVAAHTHHAPGGAGSSCYNCHMPYTTWGLMKSIRSHRIDTPTVAASLATGRPNACNLCHLDRTLAWSAKHLEEWYEQPAPELNAEQRSTAASILWILGGDAGQRGLMAAAMGREEALEVSGSDWLAPYLAQLLEDPYDVVRFRASRSLRALPGFAELDVDFVGPTDGQARSRLEAVEIWQRQRAGVSEEERSQLLFAPDGSLRWEAFQRLLSRREDHPVNLAE